jgi:hypothetical protein
MLYVNIAIMKRTSDFPKFECAISNTMEDYDSEVETFFTHLGALQSDIGLLLQKDGQWNVNYKKMLGYLQDLETSVILKKGVPDSEFLIGLIPKENVQDEISDVLLRAVNEIPAILIRAQTRTRDVATLYVRMSRVPRFAEGFTVERFEGLPNLRKALWNRAVEISKKTVG